jgi:cyclic-di-AMP phosphodiesterase PgpH
MHMKKIQMNTENGSSNHTGIRILIWILIVAVVVSTIAVPVLLSGNRRELIAKLRTKYTEGTLAQEDVVALETFYYVDDLETKKAQDEASRAILPQFSFSINSSQQMLSLVDSLFSIAGQYVEMPETAISEIQALFAEYGIDDRQNIASAIVSLPTQERNTLHAIVRETIGKLITSGIFDQKEIDAIVDQGYSRLDLVNSLEVARLEIFETKNIASVVTLDKLERTLFSWFKTYGARLSLNQNVQAIELISLLLKPNVFYDELGTAVARKIAVESVKPSTVLVESGQYILKKDFVITEQDIRTLQALLLASMQYSFLEQVGRLFFVVIVTLCAIYALQVVFAHSHRKNQFILIFLGGMLITVWAIYLIINRMTTNDLPTLDPFLPVLVLPIVMALLTNRKRAGMIAAITLGSYAILLPSATVSTVFFVVGVCFFGIYFIRYVSKRIDMLFQWFFGVVASSFLVVLNNLLMGFSYHGLIPLITAMVVNVSVTYVMVTVLLPIAEMAFNIPTTFRLRELAYSDSPVLMKLSRNAQGTYNHSQVVADLSYAAAVKVGADPLLARVGAMYHDIGKLDNPEYFIENQSGDNKHDELKTSLSVAIIKSHVKIGVEKGREAGLPQEVLDIISQHHGNDIIPFFLKEAQEEALANKSNARVKIEDYSYANRPPQTPEAAVVMIADSVEAASRAIKKPSIQKYEKLVNQVIMGKIERKQLYDSRLSLTDLDEIADSLVKTLVGRSHKRLEYNETPEEEKQS